MISRMRMWSLLVIAWLELIITQVAEYVPDKINKIAYLCALLPKNGESLGEKTANIKGPVVTINQTNMTSEPYIGSILRPY